MPEEFKIDVEKYKEDGCYAIEGFFTEEEVNELKNETKKLIDEMANDESRTEFYTENQKANEYFLESADKIRYFFEDEALDEAGNFKVPKQRAVNKLGNALHSANPVFQKATCSEKVKSIVRQLGMKKPHIVQSMYIFKQPFIGAPVNPHQDATYLHTEPVNLVGLWIALEESTLENGCLWLIPGSHKNGTFKRFIRNPDPTGPLTVWAGKPLEFDATKFVPIPAKPGTLVLIHGEVIHKSEANRSTKSREIYTFHIAETVDTVYSKENWLQPPPESPFPFLYED